MDGFDANNHLRDLHREADLRRLARLVQAGAGVKQPGWVSRQVGHWLYSLGNGLAELGERMKRGRSFGIDPVLSDEI